MRRIFTLLLPALRSSSCPPNTPVACLTDAGRRLILLHLRDQPESIRLIRKKEDYSGSELSFLPVK